MASPVTFDYSAWVARYPEFSAVQSTQAQTFFNEATIYCKNDGTGPITDQTVQLTLLNMLTAHIAALFVQSQGDPLPGQAKDANVPVGRIAGAGQGSVNVTFQNDYPPGTAQWFQQTKYGAQYWAATAQYRTMRYLPGRSFGPYGPYQGRVGGPWER